MDLSGLRNHQDNTNAEVIKNCRDALSPTTWKKPMKIAVWN
jgi:hypothetical protein